VVTHIDSAHAIAHNKVMVIDGRVVLTGSFNFTRGAEERNAENLLVIDDTRLAERYDRNWREHIAHATRYLGRGAVEQNAGRRRQRR
jgi:phosphatidylserine/phosphatidylglycerophosphate/cardiolipin synthase-like enzyme